MADTLTRFVPFGDKQVEVQRPIDTQYMILGREAVLLQSENIPPERKVRSMNRIMTIVENCIVDPDDREYVLDLVADGRLEFKPLIDVLFAFDKEEAPAPPKPRRGRPPKRIAA